MYIHFEKCLKCFLGRKIIYKTEKNKRKNKKKTKRTNYVHSFDLNFLNQLYRYISSKINNFNHMEDKTKCIMVSQLINVIDRISNRHQN